MKAMPATTLLRRLALAFLLLVASASLLAPWIAPSTYDAQFRESPDALCSRRHPLGTDALGRDRLSRVLYGSRVSLLLAPAAAALATLLAGALGAVAGYRGGWLQSALMTGTELVLSMPWLFLLITVRAVLPLNTPPLASVVITFCLLGCLGWAGAARVVCAASRSYAHSDFVLLGHAHGTGTFRMIVRHVAPNLLPILSAQFWLSIPVFILTEANLGLLGLGVAEPLPSWGSLLRELESYPPSPRLLVPLALVVLTVSCFQFALQPQEPLP